ncbi:MAG TPA: FAD-dependent oxidoreductase [bacterium]|nr:FAD-dependent oxidoreductase [bacterium]HOL49052.1 FAD-dependent oxidoreductase [bacterium]HPO51998.1 FAD-dependent oxidoreductase [bacterium]HXK44780.1 FAD-dependent oxidoreductase [bacterium]
MRIQTSVLSNIVRTDSARSVKVIKPESFSFLPGQFFKVYANDGFRYLSASCSTRKNYLEFTKKITQSDFSAWFKSLNKDDVITIDGPYGKFVIEPDDDKILFVAGGIGITPIFSMLEEAAISNDNERDYILFYGNKTINDIIFYNELQEFTKKIQLKIFHFLEEEREDEINCHHGYIEIQKIQKFLPDIADRTIFICGPPTMVNKLDNDTKKFKIAKKVKVERLVGY